MPRPTWPALLTAAAVVALLGPTPALRADEPTKAIPYRLTDTKHVLVRVKLNGKGPYNLILDTGAPAVFIPKKVAKEVGVKLDDKGWGTYDKFELEGGLVVPKTQTRVADLFQLEGMNGMGLAGVELHGVIGYNVLAQYRITYDFSADKLAWAKLDYTPAKVQAGGKDNSQGGLEVLGPVMKMFASFMGITPNFQVTPRGLLGLDVAANDGKVTVASLLAGGPAAEAGLKVGDQITAAGFVKGRAKPDLTDIDSLRDLQRVVKSVPAGQAVRLEVKREGKPVTLTVTAAKGL